MLSRLLSVNMALMPMSKFIIENRSNLLNTDYDIIIGPTADARAQDEIEKFIRTHKTKKPSIKDYKQLISKLNP